ncbi:MAG: SOUL family heme-binding protein [Rhodoglobus sp.]
MTENQPYVVESAHDEFEVRRYPEHILAEVDVDGEFFEARNRGFRPLISYISGNNAGRSKVAMTAPVIQAPAGKQYTVSFVLPEGMDAASVPVPTDAGVRTRVVPAGRVAARRFSGGADEARYAANAAQLVAAVTQAGLAVAGTPYFARYDPPWKPGFLRRNEALVRLAE